MEDKSLEESLTCCFSESVASELPEQDYIPAAAASSLSWLCGAISPEVWFIDQFISTARLHQKESKR